MSPVSRGRKAKKAKKGKKPPARATSSGWGKAARREFGVSSSASAGFSRPLDRYTQWWEPSHERVIAASGGLLAAPGPRALEQAAAELVGAELYHAVHEERYGLRFDTWAVELIDRAAKRIADAASRGDDSWRGPWWLLHGLASIGSYGLGGYAWEQVSKALPPDAQVDDPEWLKPPARPRGGRSAGRGVAGGNAAGYRALRLAEAVGSFPGAHRRLVG